MGFRVRGLACEVKSFFDCFSEAPVLTNNVCRTLEADMLCQFFGTSRRLAQLTMHRFQWNMQQLLEMTSIPLPTFQLLVLVVDTWLMLLV